MTCSKKVGFWVWKNLGVLPPKRPADGSGVFQSLKDEPQVSRCVYSAHMPGTYFLRLVVVTKGVRVAVWLGLMSLQKNCIGNWEWQLLHQL